MRKVFLIVVSSFALIPALATVVSGQQRAAGQSIPTRTSIPHSADGHPDFTGVWAGPGFTHRVGPGDTDTPRVSNFDPRNFAPFKPGGEALFMQKETGKVLHDDPTAKCLPDGFPREALAPYATQILQSPAVVIFLYEYMHFFRVVPTDGRPHPKDVEPTFMGDSVAHWEADTLVIDTIGLREWTLDATTRPAIRYHSDALHVIERIQYTDPMTASYQITIDDPKIFTRAWSQDFGMKLHPSWKLYNRCARRTTGAKT